ncbi:tRNA dimethylallyltransferase [Aurantiacibacter gangjinensis]|nr:tRNA dimethylallyltransferase [Aurantiacibacter gangjinensis]
MRLALHLRSGGRDAVVVNADSAQVYADLHVLSARPSEEEMRGVPHRLFGTWDGAEACSAADWATAAKAEIAAAHGSEAVPILVGGTGLYIRTLLDGIAPIPEIDADIRAAVRALPVAEAYGALQVEDPASAARLAPADSQRISRALEVVRSTGAPLDVWHTRMTGGIAEQVDIAPLVLLPDRDWLHARCDLRFERMLESGAVAEVEALLSRNLDPDLPVMRAIGVPQIAAMLRGEMSREDAIAAGQLATRQYAKRQYTWLRNQLPTHWARRDPVDVDIDSVVRIK